MSIKIYARFSGKLSVDEVVPSGCQGCVFYNPDHTKLLAGVNNIVCHIKLDDSKVLSCGEDNVIAIEDTPEAQLDYMLTRTKYALMGEDK